jgi:hypothetical protein
MAGRFNGAAGGLCRQARRGPAPHRDPPTPRRRSAAHTLYLIMDIGARTHTARLSHAMRSCRTLPKKSLSAASAWGVLI